MGKMKILSTSNSIGRFSETLVGLRSIRQSCRVCAQYYLADSAVDVPEHRAATYRTGVTLDPIQEVQGQAADIQPM